MKKYRILINYDYEDSVDVAARKAGYESNYMVPWLLEKEMSRWDNIEVLRRNQVKIFDGQEPKKVKGVDMVFNSPPIADYDFLIAQDGMTAFWDLEECSDPRKQYYKNCDVIFHPNYNPYMYNLYPMAKTSYLPLANDFEVSKYYEDEPLKYEIAWLGRENMLAYDRRKRILNKLGEKFIMSPTRGASLPRGEVSSRLISRGLLTIQISGLDNLEERFFQFGAIRPIVVDYLEEIDFIAEKDVDYIGFTTDDECLEKVDYYIEHYDEAEKMWRKLEAKLKKRHQYKHRVREILRILDGGKMDHKGVFLWDKQRKSEKEKAKHG